MDSTELIDGMEHYISDSYEKDGHNILFFEYVPEELWEKVRAALLKVRG